MKTSEAVFIDTSGWIALLNADDYLHADARRLLNQFGVDRRHLVTTDWVLAETGNGLAKYAARVRFARSVEVFVTSATGRLVRIEEPTFQRALSLYAQASDKTWGLVDCASFVIMRDQGLTAALTADRDFEQAGFQCLLPKQ